MIQNGLTAMFGRRRFLTATCGAVSAACLPTLALGNSRGNDRRLPRVLIAHADELLDRFSVATGITDFSVVVMRGERRLYESYRGGFAPDTVLNIASASKWLVGATAMALVARGRLRLDAPIDAYVPGLPSDYASLRLDLLLSFTAGLPSLKAAADVLQRPNISLNRSARLAARKPLISVPGTQFDYGGANLQFIGAAVENVTGLRWQAAFEELIGDPLRMQNTLWGRTLIRPRRSFLPRNPLLQGGAWTTMDDYAAFLTMITQHGRYQTRQVLPQSAVRQMATVMTIGVAKGYMPPGAADRPIEYAIAHWCERLERERCTFESSPGAYGTYPWLDWKAGLHGIIFLKDKLNEIVEEEVALRDGLIELFG